MCPGSRGSRSHKGRDGAAKSQRGAARGQRAPRKRRPQRSRESYTEPQEPQAKHHPMKAVVVIDLWFRCRPVLGFTCTHTLIQRARCLFLAFLVMEQHTVPFGEQATVHCVCRSGTATRCSWVQEAAKVWECVSLAAHMASSPHPPTVVSLWGWNFCRFSIVRHSNFAYHQQTSSR